MWCRLRSKGKSLFEVHQSYLRTLGPCYLIGWILTRLIRESRGESDLKEDLADFHSQDPEKRFWDPVCNTVSFLANKGGELIYYSLPIVDRGSCPPFEDPALLLHSI